MCHVLLWQRFLAAVLPCCRPVWKRMRDMNTRLQVLARLTSDDVSVGEEPCVVRRMDDRSGGQRWRALQVLDGTRVWVKQAHLALASDTDKSAALRQNKAASLC